MSTLIDETNLKKDGIAYYQYKDRWWKVDEKIKNKIFVVGIVAGIPNQYMIKEHFYECHRGFKSGLLVSRALAKFHNVFYTNILNTTTRIHYLKVIEKNLYNIYCVGIDNLISNLLTHTPSFIICLGRLPHSIVLNIVLDLKLDCKTIYYPHPGYCLRMQWNKEKYINDLINLTKKYAGENHE